MTETLYPELPTTRVSPFDPPPELGVLRETAPITRLRYPDGHLGWLVTSYALAREVHADTRFSSRTELHHISRRIGGQAVPQQPPAEPGMFIGMDAPEHTRYRRLLTGQFTVRRMNQLLPRVEAIVAEHLAGMRAHGSPVDLVEHFALPVPSMVICELLGVPYEDRAEFQLNTAGSLSLDKPLEEVLAAFQRVKDFVADLVRRRWDTPGDDMLGGLIATRELTPEEVTNLGILLLVAGHETTANMLGIGTFLLLTQPDQLTALRADPALVDNAVEELMRYLTIIQLGTTRTALEDVEIGGVVVRAGETLSISVSAANRDPERFERPDEFDIGRPASGHLGFGHGAHQCLGQQLARIEMRVGYSALFREFPDLRLAVPASEVRMRTDMSIYGVHELPVAFS